MTPEQQKKFDAERRTIIRNLFNSDPELRADARQELREAWRVDQAAFNEEELATVDPQSAVLMAAKRDGNREVVEWILKL